jgi:hypothetical protein
MKTKIQILFTRSFISATWCVGAVILISATAQAQTNIFIFSGSETNITLAAGTYNITAYGAQGGSGYYNSVPGGLGAEMIGEFSFGATTSLTLLVGSSGGAGGILSGGGGGGSFVVNGSTPLIIASGGGGGAYEGSGLIGSTNTSGVPGVPGGAGGTGGNGGGGGFAGGGGGGGFYSDGNIGGGNGASGGGASYGDGGGGGAANGGYGPGGYGGGGGGCSGGGGGGGYSGGGGGEDEGGNPAPGGGGGSFIDPSATSVLAEVSGIASLDGSPNGEIIITAVSGGSASTPPALGISTYGSQPAVFFPTATGTNYVLQMTTNLTPPVNWVTVTNGVPIIGIIISNPPAAAFFRLH